MDRTVLRRVAIVTWTVLRRPQWLLTAVLLALGILTAQDASEVAVLLGLILALIVASNAMHLLGVEALNPVTMLRTFFSSRTPSLWRLLGSSALLALTIGIVMLVPLITDSAVRLAAIAHGDANLMVAFFVAVCATLVSATVTLVWWGHRRLIRLSNVRADGAATVSSNANPSSDSATVVASDEEVITVVEAAIRYWQGVTASLTLAVIALIPAALLANWAWNVAASVVLPILVLSIRRAYDDRSRLPSIAER